MPQPPPATTALPSPSDFDHLPQRCRGMSRSERLRALCGDQSLRWEGGKPVAVDRYLEAFPELAANPREAMPLIVGEWLHRFDRGDLPRLSDYQRRFPRLADELARQFDLYLTLARSRATQAPGRGATAVVVAEPPALAGYEVLGELGRGGMGVVYKARQKSLDRLVAIKVVLQGVGARPEQLVRFRQEAELLARLTHPNVVQVFEAGAHAGHGYLVMEFIDGPSLTQHCGGQAQPPASAARLVETLARAVDHANRQGVIHRDIKPSNVLLTSAGVPKLTDFGLAKSLQAGETGMTATGDVLGTPAYMAPEQARGQARQVGPATDVYGLGATLYELLTGCPPFEGATPLDVLLKVTSDDPSSVRSARPEVPADLETVCLKCLQKDPNKRYATAEALAEDLHRFQTGRPIAARPVGVAEKTWRWARRHPGVAALLLAIFVSLTAGLAVSTSLAVWALRSEEAADRRREEAEGARRDTQRQLWESMLNEARGIRRSGRRGQRFDALAKLKEALALARQLGELSEADRKRFRDEAAACLMLMDVEVAKEWPGWPAGSMNLAYDPEQQRYARQSAKDQSISIRRVADDRLIATLPGQGLVSGYGGLAFSPGGDWFARCAESSGLVEVWRLSGDGATKAWQVPGGSHVQFSPDGSLLAVASAGQTTRLFETASGRLRKHLAQGAVVFGDPFHPTKPHLALARGQSVRVVDFITGQVTVEAGAPFGGCFAWHPAGRLFAFTDPSNTIGLYDAATGEPALPPLQGHTSQGIVVTFDPTGEVLASTDWSGILRVWDVRSGRLLFSGMSPPVFGPVRFSPARTLAGSHHAGQLSLLRLPATPVRTLASNLRGSSPDHCALSPDGRRLACSDNLDTVVIDLPTAKPLARLPDVRPVRFEPDGRGLLTTSPYGMYRWPITAEPGTGAVRVGPPGSWVRWRSGERVGVSADLSVVAFGIPSGAVVGRLGAPPQRWLAIEPQHDVRRCDVSPDGSLLLSGSHVLGNVTAYDTTTGRAVKRLADQGGRGTFSPHGRLAAVDTWDQRVQLWRVKGWEPVADFPGTTHCFSDDEALLAVGSSGAVTLLEGASGRELVRIEIPEQTRLEPLAFVQGGAELIVNAADLRVLLGWDLRRIRAELKPLGLDWDQPESPPPPPPAAGEATPWEVVGAGLVKDPKLAARRERDEALATLAFLPFDALSHARLGHALLELGQTGEAYRRLNFALGLRPDLLDARRYRFNAARALGHWLTVAVDATDLMDRAPFYRNFQWERAEALEHLGLSPLAILDYYSLRKLAPSSFDLQAALARNYEALRWKAPAAACREKALRLAPADPAALNAVAWDLLTGEERRRDPLLAARLAERAVQKSPNDPNPRNTLGVALYRTGRIRDAIPRLERALALGKGTADGHNLYFLALCHHRLGDAAQAKRCLEQANRWVGSAKALLPQMREELRLFRAEAERTLKAPPPPGSP